MRHRPSRLPRLLAGGAVFAVLAPHARAQSTAPGAPAQAAPTQAADPSRLTVERIFGRGEFAASGAPGLVWTRDGRSYVEVRPAAGGGSDVVRVDAASGAATVLVPAGALRDEAGRAIVIEDLQLSPDERKALLFHNSVRVWRTNTRGTFHVVDFATRRVTPIATVTTPGKPSAAASNAPSTVSGSGRSGVRVKLNTPGGVVVGRQDTVAGQALGQRTTGVPAGAPSFIGRGLASGAVDADLQMFAKFSPDSRSVAYVRGNNLWVTDLATGRATRLTSDGSDDVINGTTDWVYEEELGLRDAFRWSPDSRRLAYWRFDQSAVPAYPIIDATDGPGPYPTVSVLRYPKAGMPNSRVKLGVVAAAGGGATRWLAVGPDTGQYVAQAEWLGVDSVAVLRVPRRQNRLDVLLASAATGGVRTVTSDVDSAYVDVEGGPVTWIDGGRRFLLRSDRSGWRAFHLYDRSGRYLRQVTPDGADYLEVAGIDSARGYAYVSAAAPTPTQRNLFRCSLDGSPAAAGAAAPACTRVTTADGTHALELAPGNAYAVDTYSTAFKPPVATLYAVGGDGALRTARVLEDNAGPGARFAALGLAAPQFFRVPMPDGTQLDAYRITPARFDSAAKHPVLMHVYGGPAAPQVNDAWGGSRMLWHQMLAQQGYVVVVVDNRGAAWRGRAFRKVTQGRLGVQESQDQIDAARWVGRQPWADAQRIGLWGWSYGGYMTGITLARGGSVYKAGISVAPVVDWRYYDSIYTERYMNTPQNNPNGYQLSAVGSYVGNMAARLLLVYGTGDDNVHPQNSLVLAQALENANKPFTMLLYPNKTHSISGARTQVHLFGSLTRFVLDNL